MKHKRVTNLNQRPSMRTWNAMVDRLNHSQVSGNRPVPPILSSSTIVNAIGVGAAVDPFTPVRIRTPIDFQSSANAIFEAEAVDTGGFANNHWTYGFTLNEGMSVQGGGRVVIGGIGLVVMTRDKLTGASFLHENDEWRKLWYNVPDESISDDSTRLIGPTGHYKVVSAWERDEVEDSAALGTDEVLVAINMSTQPSTILVNVEAEIDGFDSDVMTGLACKVLFGDTNASATKRGIQETTDFKVLVYNPYEAKVAINDRLTAIWSSEMKCFVANASLGSRLHCELPSALAKTDSDISACPVVRSFGGLAHPATVTLKNVPSGLTSDYIHEGDADSIALVSYDDVTGEYWIDGIECPE